MAVLESASSSTGSSDEQLVNDRLDQLLAEHDPKGDVVAFLGAQFDAGLAWVHFPEGEGGLGLNPKVQKLVMERIAEVGGPNPYYRNPIGYGMGAPTVMSHGSEAQKSRYLRPLFTGEEVWCQLFSEPGAGSDVASLSSRAVRDGDEWVVNGQKVWTTLAHISRWGMLVARTDPEQPKHKGLTYFVVDMHAPGVEVRPLKQITGSAEFSEVFFTDVRVPAANLIGEAGQGWELAQTTLGFERGGNLLARVTRHRGVLSQVVGAAGRLRPEWRPALEDPLVRQKLGQMLAGLEVLRYAGLRGLSRLEKGQRPGPEASVDKLYYSEMDKRHQELIQEILGPYGQLTEGLPPELELHTTTSLGIPADWTYSYLYSRAGTIYAGSSEIQKNIIGERALKLPREARADRAAPANRA